MSSSESKIKTYNLIILDKSGSMQNVAKETIEGLNEQFKSMKKTEEDYKDQEQIVCLVNFSYQVEVTNFWNKRVSNIPKFSNENYQPDGGTALYDAIGTGISKLREEIKDELSARTANVIVTIFTDGEENASKAFSGAQVKKLIEDVKDTGQWTIAFLGCGDNVFEVANSIGISSGNTMSYSSGAAGTTQAFTKMSHARMSRAVAYSNCAEMGLCSDNLNKDMDFFDGKNIDIKGTDSDII